jgi:hypothetical protein
MSDKEVIKIANRVHNGLVITGMLLLVTGGWYHWPLFVAFGIVLVAAETLQNE